MEEVAATAGTALTIPHPPLLHSLATLSSGKSTLHITMDTCDAVGNAV